MLAKFIHSRWSIGNFYSARIITQQEALLVHPYRKSQFDLKLPSRILIRLYFFQLNENLTFLITTRTYTSVRWSLIDTWEKKNPCAKYSNCSFDHTLLVEYVFCIWNYRFDDQYRRYRMKRQPRHFPFQHTIPFIFNSFFLKFAIGPENQLTFSSFITIIIIIIIQTKIHKPLNTYDIWRMVVKRV